jgi:hypothetical protein
VEFSERREAILDANNKSPAEVLQYALDALRQANAKLIEAAVPTVW